MCLRNRRPLFANLRTHSLCISERCLYLGLDLGFLRAVIPHIKLHQWVPLLHILVFLNQNAINIAADLGGHYNRIGCDIGVVGTLKILPCGLIVPVPPRTNQ